MKYASRMAWSESGSSKANDCTERRSNGSEDAKARLTIRVIRSPKVQRREGKSKSAWTVWPSGSATSTVACWEEKADAGNSKLTVAPIRMQLPYLSQLELPLPDTANGSRIDSSSNTRNSKVFQKVDGRRFAPSPAAGSDTSFGESMRE